MASQDSNVDSIRQADSNRRCSKGYDLEEVDHAVSGTISRTFDGITQSHQSDRTDSGYLTWSSRSSTAITTFTGVSSSPNPSLHENSSHSKSNNWDYGSQSESIRFARSPEYTPEVHTHRDTNSPSPDLEPSNPAGELLEVVENESITTNRKVKFQAGNEASVAENPKASATSSKDFSDSSVLYASLALPSMWSIRILQLLPAVSRQAQLRGQLSVERLDEPLDYEAISYTWGQPFDGFKMPAGHIRIQDHRLPIAANLDCALRRLRRPDRLRRIWIDALCINQFDDRERGYQIEIMEHIYARARSVLVWLGEDSSAKDGRYIFEFCRLIERHGARPPRKAILAYQSLWPKFKALAGLFARRNYFRRRWTIQEMCHASGATIMCGPWSASFSTFMACMHKVPASRRAMEDVKNLFITIDHLREALHHWRLDSLRSSQASTLSDFIWILQRFHSFECLDPRDRLYALASLWKGGWQSLAEVIESGYSAGCDQLYIEFAGSIIKHYLPDSQVLCRILSVAADQACNIDVSKQDIKLPSWVVDWRRDPAPRIGAADVFGDIHIPGSFEAPYSTLRLCTRSYGEIVESGGHYRDWVLKSSTSLLMPSYYGIMPDEDYAAALGGLCPKIQVGDILCQPFSTYRARNKHVADAALVLRPTGTSSGSYRIVGRCPLDLWWNEAQGEERKSDSIPTDSLVALID